MATVSICWLKSLKRREMIEPYDHPNRWLIPSRSKEGESYLVDLAAHDFRGECQCKDFVVNFRRKPTHRCYHIREARHRFADWAIRQFSK